MGTHFISLLLLNQSVSTVILMPQTLRSVCTVTMDLIPMFAQLAIVHRYESMPQDNAGYLGGSHLTRLVLALSFAGPIERQRH